VLVSKNAKYATECEEDNRDEVEFQAQHDGQPVGAGIVSQKHGDAHPDIGCYTRNVGRSYATAVKPFLLSLAGALPMVAAGYGVLTLLAASSLSALRLILGFAIIVSSLQLIRRPSPLARQSGGPAFLFFGALGGLMGGLFSTAGPPLVFQFYRQPLPHRVVRETLVAIFALNSVFRLGLVAANGDWRHHALSWALAGLPAVLVSTYLARRWPPALSARTLRFAAFVLLLLSGVSLIAPVILGLVPAAME
jgi:hypothetical protein